MVKRRKPAAQSREVGPSSDVFGWLDEVRARPGMYLYRNDLRQLEALVRGYYTALGVHGMVEPVPSMNIHFMDWLRYRTGWSVSQGWAAAIEREHPKREGALATFFRLADEYRRLRPVRVCTVRLGAGHNPTGKRVVRGYSGRMEKPRRVDVVRYRPAPLHFLRIHYPGRVQDWELLMTRSGDYATTVRHAKQWVRDELQVPFTAWKPVPLRR